ncbi:hypothetical protein N0V86_007067 [Didymella sp. IMI 355093]|nr:hypothetical protein N0V86_007067 [Didymella sp. IMI 355093]
MIRLRCVKWPAEMMPKDEEWAIADNSWVPYSYFTLNGVPLQLRKKLHNGKDLPVDLTGLITKGENVLQVSVVSKSDDTAYRNYLVAIEFLGVMTKTSIEKRCREKIIAAKDVIRDIKRKLSTQPTDDDDDIVLMENARPNSLAVDGFLVEVRTELERKGLLDTRAIIVSQDGSWKPKPEERDPNGVSDRDTPEPTPSAARTASRSKSAVVLEVIDLDSD